MAKQQGTARKPVLQLDKASKRIMSLMCDPKRARDFKNLMLNAIEAEKNFKNRKSVDRNESVDK